MRKYLILAQSNLAAEALRKVLGLTWVETEKSSHKVADVPAVVMVYAESSPHHVFEHVASRIRAELDEGATVTGDQATILVDCFNLLEANPLQSTRWSGVVGMLILAFPEHRWVFGCLQGANDVLTIKRWHSLDALFSKMPATTLGDGSGLRHFLRQMIAMTEEKKRKVAPYVPLRVDCAAALDDEENYAYFNAYVAYRFGFRAWPVCSDEQARSLFSCAKADVESVPAPVCLTFEDICISYPDGSQDTHYSDLSGDDDASRKSQLPLLEKADYRIFVTTQHQQDGQASKNECNNDYIHSGQCVLNGSKPNRYGELVLKPYSGLFDLWRSSGLDRQLVWWDQEGTRFRGVGKDYAWPPREPCEPDGDTGHSAPGRLLLIATHLLRRCEKFLASASSVQEAVRCAILATDALELLGDRTPTIAMDALRLKHLAEVTAECQFSGVEYKIEMKARLTEIRRDATHIGRWFDRRQQAMAAMNAEMTTLVDIIHVLRKHGQFDEIQICQNRIRYLHNRLWMHKTRVGFMFLPFLAYFEFVLSSFVVFSFMLVFWGIVFILLFHLASILPVVKVPVVFSDWSPAIKDTLERFITLKEYRHGESFWWCMTATFAAVMSITHIGLFISHLQLILKRKE